MAIKTRNTSSILYGIATSGPGKHERKLSYPAHRAWRQMLQRCYCPEAQKRQLSYIGCTVCEEWLDYQTFADWYVSQRGHDIGWQLDKDLLSERNNTNAKVYSPETCILLPAYINKVLIEKPKTLDLPHGVYHNNNDTSVFVARCRDEHSKLVHLGTFKTAEEASKAYKQKKQMVLNYLAAKFKEALDPKAYSTLHTYFVS